MREPLGSNWATIEAEEVLVSPLCIRSAPPTLVESDVDHKMSQYALHVNERTRACGALFIFVH